ncbi:hypothetical protein V6N11_037720 [Hibiscus sabdariffa]|uniref:Uncharacterized protein n=1 Tax=Hibiscus sabdariffa TaxID=183260 RepID=A0ABR2PC37_9ROSI
MIEVEARGNNRRFRWWGTQMVTRNKRLMVGVGVEQRDEEETMGWWYHGLVHEEEGSKVVTFVLTTNGIGGGRS